MTMRRFQVREDFRNKCFEIIDIRKPAWDEDRVVVVMWNESAAQRAALDLNEIPIPIQ